MIAVLVDTNVLIDIATNDAVWGQWSMTQLAKLADTASLIINPIIYAEASVAYATIEQVDAHLDPNMFKREPLPYEAGFLVGKAFLAYRRRGGSRQSPLPDFYVGAHAACCGYRLLTRDPQRYRSYFPTLEIIAPTKPG